MKSTMTYAALLEALQKLTPEQLACPAIYSGQYGSGPVGVVRVLEEDMINPSGDGWEPRAAYLPGGEYYDDISEADRAGYADEEIVARKGQPFLEELDEAAAVPQ